MFAHILKICTRHLGSLADHVTVLSSNPTKDEVYSIKLYVIKLSVTCGRSVVSPVSSINKTDRHDIT